MVKVYAHRGEDNATLADLVIGRGLSCDKAELLLHIAKVVHQAKNEPFLEYAIKQYGFSDLPPIWTMMEVLPMGTL